MVAAAKSELQVGGRAELREQRGITVVEWRSERVLFFRTIGHLSPTLAAFALERNAAVLDALQERGFALHACYDWAEMTGYDSEARAACTDFLRAHQMQFASIDILTGSSLVAMAVTVANMLVSGFMRGTTNRAEFDERVAAWIRNP